MAEKPCARKVRESACHENIAADIAADLEAAMAQFATIAEDLKK